MKIPIVKGATSVLVRVFIQDSSSTTGAGLTGLVFNSSSLVCYRMRDDDGNAGATQISLASATLGTWTSGGFKEKDATNAPGWYEFGIPDNALATGSRTVSIHFKGATNMAPCPLEILLTSVNDQSTGFGLVNVSSNVVQLLGTAWLTPGTAGTPDVNVKLWNALATVALPLIPTVAGRTLDVSAGGEAGMDWANVGSPTTAVDLSNTTIKTTQKVDVDTIKTNPVVNGGTLTFPTNATVASTTNLTAGTIATVSGNVNGNVGGNVTGSVGSVAAGGIAAASFAAGAIDATAIAANAIGSSELAADCITSSQLAASAAQEIRDAVFARAFSAAYGSFTFTELTELIAASLLAKCSGMGTTTGTFRNLDDSADTIVATIDANGNRTAVTLTP